MDNVRNFIKTYWLTLLVGGVAVVLRLLGMGKGVAPGKLEPLAPIGALLRPRYAILLIFELPLLAVLGSRAELRLGRAIWALSGLLGGLIAWTVYMFVPLGEAFRAGSLSPIVAGLLGALLIAKEDFELPNGTTLKPWLMVLVVGLILALSKLLVSAEYIVAFGVDVLAFGVGAIIAHFAFRPKPSVLEQVEEFERKRKQEAPKPLVERLGVGKVEQSAEGGMRFKGDRGKIEAALWGVLEEQMADDSPHDALKTAAELIAFYKEDENWGAVKRVVDTITNRWNNAAVPVEVLEGIIRFSLAARDAESADRYMKTLIALYPDSILPRRYMPDLIWCYIAQKRYDPASEWLGHYKKMNPPPSTLKWLEEALVVGRTRIIKVLTGDVMDTTALIGSGRYQEAYQHAARATAKDLSADMLVLLFDGLIKYKHYDEAIKTAQWILQFHEAEPEAAYALFQGAMIMLHNKGDKINASKWFSKLISKYPDSPWSEEAMKMLEELETG